MLTRESLPAIPDDCLWNITHDGKRRGQPVRVEVRRVTPERMAGIRDGSIPHDRALAFSHFVAWDYSTGDVQDIAEVTLRLARIAEHVHEVAVGIIA